MKLLSWLIVLGGIGFIIFATLGAVNFAGIGDAVGGFMQNSLVAPLRSFAFNTHATIGTSGWYMILSFMVISIFGAFFWIPIFYNLFIKKTIGEKMLHRTPTVQPTFQNQPDTTTIPVTNLQSQPTTQTKPETPVKEETT